MKHVLISAFVLALASPAFAQPVAYTFTVSPDEANVMLNKVGELPWKDVNPLMQKLVAQLNAQNHPPAPPAAASSEQPK